MPSGQEHPGIPEDPSARVIPRRGVRALCARLRNEGKRIVFTNGCFDLLHAGHAQYLRRAAALGDVLLVGLNSDASVRRLKGEGRPVQRAADRAYLLASLSCVSYVTIFPEDTPARLIGEVVPHVLVKGGDWKGKEIVGSDAVRSRGGAVKTIRFLPGRSTTSILERAAELRGKGPGSSGGRTGTSRSRRAS
ncbi:MAG: D-glycero-beta-D-manno-heptose 1-phosphate adenylyltransferase [Deltaproteobacteria bacterium]|nr:D-glycero-beta-D-manno-heptose 1-phosphate adenylyltransferase [Deltaproteobacteria bacterium]